MKRRNTKKAHSSGQFASSLSLADVINPPAERQRLLKKGGDLSVDDIRLINEIDLLAPELDPAPMRNFGQENSFGVLSPREVRGSLGPKFGIDVVLPNEPRDQPNSIRTSIKHLVNSFNGSLTNRNDYPHSLHRNAGPGIRQAFEDKLIGSVPNPLSQSQKLVGNEVSSIGDDSKNKLDRDRFRDGRTDSLPSKQDTDLYENTPRSRIASKREERLSDTVGIPESKMCRQRSDLLIQLNRDEKIYKAAADFHRAEVGKAIQSADIPDRLQQQLIALLKAIARGSFELMKGKGWQEALKAGSTSYLRDSAMSETKIQASLDQLQKIIDERNELIGKLEKNWKNATKNWNSKVQEHRKDGCNMDVNRVRDFQKISREDILQYAYPD